MPIKYSYAIVFEASGELVATDGLLLIYDDEKTARAFVKAHNEDAADEFMRVKVAKVSVHPKQ